MKLSIRKFNEKPDYFKRDQERIIKKILDYERDINFERNESLEKLEEEHCFFLERRGILARDDNEVGVGFAVKEKYLNCIKKIRREALW